MLDKFLDEYVEKLYIASNINMDKNQRNLYKKSNYYKILKPVINILKNNKDKTLDELRNILFLNSDLVLKTNKFIKEMSLAPGVVYTYGTCNYKETVVLGNRQEVALSDENKFIPSTFNMTHDTIFDLASLTKVFTSLAIFKLLELNLINLDDSIIKYLPEFNNLKNITIFDLLSFKKGLATDKRIDNLNYKDARDTLLNIKPCPIYDNTYTDMGAIVLKYVIEKVSGMSYYDFLNNFIFKELNLEDTYQTIPNYKLDRCASTIGSIKYLKDKSLIIDKEPFLGIVHDPKARVLSSNEDLPGHAGLFSTTSDMSKVARSIIDNKVISKDNLSLMTTNQTGRRYIENNEYKYRQYLACMCYSKHPIKKYSELYHALSGNSFAMGGYTGVELTVDSINQIFFFLGTNRVHNRLTYIDPSLKNKIITLRNNRKILNVDENYITSSVDFAYERDKYIIHPSLKLAIQYKMLEDYYKLLNEKIEKEEKIKVL